MTVAFPMAAATALAAFGTALGAATVTLQWWLRERSRAADLQHRLDMFGQLLPVGVFHTDAQGRCTYADDLSCALAGLRPQASPDDTWIEAVHPDDREHVESEWMSAAAAGRPYRGELRVLRADASTAWIAAEVRERRDRNGLAHGFVGALTDVTDRKQMEGELAELRTALESRVAERTASLAETNRRLQREVRIHERLERALTGMPSEVPDTQIVAPWRRRVDQ
jgi:PAS domain S-box-containing protein